MIINIIISAGVLVAGLTIGLLLRRFLTQRLHKTVLDNWLIQTFGTIVLVLPLLLASVTILAIWTRDQLQYIHIGNENIYTFGGNLLTKLIPTLIMLGLGIGGARTARSLTIRGLGQNHVDINLRTFIGRISYLIVLGIASLWVLSFWNLSTVPVAAISVITVAVSFSIQDILKDLVAGFYLLLERPFYIGDQVSITIAPTVTYVGKVQGIELRATKLRLIGGEEVTIPNATLFSNVVINNTYYGERRTIIMVALPKEVFQHKDTAQQIVQALKNLDIVIEKPEPTVLFSGYIEGKITLTVRFWIASGQVIDISDAMYALHTLLPTADLAVKEPVGIV